MNCHIPFAPARDTASGLQPVSTIDTNGKSSGRPWLRSRWRIIVRQRPERCSHSSTTSRLLPVKRSMKAWTAPLMTRGYGGLTTVARSRLDSANASAQASVLSSAAATSVSDAPEPPSSASRSTHRSSRPLASSREDGKASYSTAAAGVENGSAATGVRVPGAKKHSKLPVAREKQALIVMNVEKLYLRVYHGARQGVNT